MVWATISLPGDAATPSPATPPRRHAASQSPSPTTAAEVFGAHQRAADRAVVDSPRARIDAWAVVPGHPDRRIAEWSVCGDSRCDRRRTALTVTANGFADAHLVELPAKGARWYLEPAGAQHFAVALNGGRRILVDLSGHATRLTVGGTNGPLADTEVPLRAPVRGYLAVDPSTGAAHRLSVPPGTDTLLETPSGQLRALSFAAYSWSDDGGATWRHLALPLTGNELPELVATASDDVHALLVTGDGATLAPWIRALRSDDGSAWTSYSGPTVATAYVDSPVVLPDGRLLIDVQAWSDQRAGGPAPRRIGLYVGDDWSATAPVRMGPPFDASPNRSMMNILDVAVTGKTVTVYAQAPDRTTVVASSDDGATWSPIRAR